MTGIFCPNRGGRPERAGRSRRALSLVAIVLGVAVVGCTVSTETPETIYVTPQPAITVVPTPTPPPTPTPGPTPEATIGPCNADNLSITLKSSGGSYWSGGAGHQMATLELANNGSVACTLKARAQPLLLNGDDSILILGPAAGPSATLTVEPAAILHTDVQTSNMCGTPPLVPPIRVAFMIPGGTGLVVATPISPSDLGGAPSCVGDPAVYSGSINMSSWGA